MPVLPPKDSRIVDSALLHGVKRVFGASRIDTALEIAKAIYPNKISNVILATSENFPDAIAGSVYAARYNEPIILADGSLSDNAMEYLKTRKIKGATIFGGETVINKNVEQKLSQLIVK